MKKQSKLQIIKQRNAALLEMRSFFNAHDFFEVETPILVKHPGMEPNLTPYKTTDGQYLITSPEYHMKCLLAEGFEKIFQITKAFRGDEEKSPLHNQEFTMVEWYMIDTDYNDMADLTEELVQSLAAKFENDSLQKRFTRITCQEAFKKYASLELADLYNNKPQFVKEAQRKNINVSDLDTTQEIFFKILLTKIESRFTEPTFLFDFPAELAALSKIKKDNPMWCERFELYINSMEVANAFSELTDSKEQLTRLKKEQKERKSLGKEVLEIDTEFVEALQYIQKASGIALGFDRLLMALIGAETIQDVILFPNQ